MEKSANVDDAVAFYVLETPKPGNGGYRGLGRWDLTIMRAVEQECGLGAPSGVQLEWEVPERYDGSRDHIPLTRGVVDAARRYLAGVEWAKIPGTPRFEWVPAGWELVGAVRVFSDDDVRRAVDRITRACVEELGEEPGEVRLYGVDIIEWPSAWSAMLNREMWTKEPVALNEHGLAPTYEDGIRIWQDYLRSSDPDFGSVALYRLMALVGCGTIWPA